MMLAQDYFEKTLRVADIVSALNELGISVQTGSDFVAYRLLRKQQSHSRPIYPMFDVGCSFIDGSNGLWIAGWDEQGDLVHTQAMRLIELGPADLRAHMRDHRLKYVTPGAVEEPEFAAFHADGGLDTVRGRVCYHGEFWLAQNARGSSGSGAVALLSRLAFELAHAIWAPDYVFGFVAAPHALNGTPARHGYFHGVPGTWRARDGGVFAEEWLVWMSANDITACLRTPFDMASKVISARTATQSRNGRASEPLPEAIHSANARVE